MNSRSAKVEARHTRVLWREARLRGEPVEAPGLELKLAWRRQKGQLQPVPPGLLKNIGKTPIRLVEPGKSLADMAAREIEAGRESIAEGQPGLKIVGIGAARPTLNDMTLYPGVM